MYAGEGPDEAQSDERYKTFQNIEEFRTRTQAACPTHILRMTPWPEAQPIIFNFRMPSETSKTMLFERLHYAIETALAKKEEGSKTLNRNTEIL